MSSTGNDGTTTTTTATNQHQRNATFDWPAHDSCDLSSETSHQATAGADEKQMIYTATGRRVLLMNGGKPMRHSSTSSHRATTTAAATRKSSGQVRATAAAASRVKFPVPADESRHSSTNAARNSSTTSTAPPHRIWVARKAQPAAQLTTTTRSKQPQTTQAKPKAPLAKNYVRTIVYFYHFGIRS